MKIGDECPACVASRASVVDAYFAGYLAGSIEMVLADDPHCGLVFCTPHEIMATKTIATMAAALNKRSGLTKCEAGK